VNCEEGHLPLESQETHHFVVQTLDSPLRQHGANFINTVSYWLSILEGSQDDAKSDLKNRRIVNLI
jgi:hypothetical protein